MRVLSAPVVLSSLALTGWAGYAGAQAMGFGMQRSQAASPFEQAACEQDQQPALGIIPQPTPDCPGLVTGATLGELFTDNLKLAGPGQPKETGWITTIEPFVKAATQTPRFSGLVDYSLTGFVYAGQSGDDQVAQKLNAFGTVTVVPQHFFIDGSARYDRAIIDNQFAAAPGAFFLSGNNANIAVGTVSPWWTQTFGTVGTATLRYTQGRVVYNTRGISGESHGALAGVPDVTSNAVQFSFVSPQYERWGWNFGYSQQRMESGAYPARQFANAKAGATFQLNYSTSLLGDVGVENRYLPDGTMGHLDAGFWDAGVQWGNSRNNVKVLVGHRFFGRTGELSWTHNAALLTTTVSYSEQPTDLNQQLLGLNPGEIVINPLNPQQFTSLADRQVYLMKRATATAMYLMPRGHLTLTLYNESRDFFLTGLGKEKVANASLAWVIDLAPYTKLTPSVAWQRYQFADGQVGYTRFGFIDLVHQINAKNFATLRFRNDSRNTYAAVPGAHGYRVNVLYAQWTHLF